ncbi:PAS domain S-box protein [Natrononativus amylolyticus]|uniref:PAS domain S-box protein n=1 Tax=Natrononativus amylolyticus TaxID=2963434 RepID=UPI0020CF8E89|nr:PAS domain-containing sensor histidine kinase [Natrononativus amylolyticus]
MDHVSRTIADIGGRRVVLAIGWLYVVAAAGLPLLYFLEVRGFGDVLTISILVGGIGLSHLYFGNLLPTLEIRADLYDDIATWYVRAIGAILAVLAFIALVGSVSDPLATTLVLTALASVAGLGMGYHDAQAKTRALDAEDRQHEAERYSQELKRYQTIVETVNDGIFIIDEEYYILFVNEAYANLVGYTREELVGAHTSVVVGDEMTAVTAQLERDLETGAANTYETTLITASGEPLAVEWNVATLPATADGDRDIVGIVRDVSNRNRRKRQLEAQNAQLENFAGMLTHELRNPVSIGQIYSQQLPETASPEAHAHVTEAFDRIEDIIDVMLVLTQGGEALTERTPVALEAVAREAWSEVDAPKATLEVTLERTLAGDETYLRHLFRNLFENAVTHGGDDVTITVGALPTGFYVADDGVGIPIEQREAIFETGYTTAADEGGMGLGLTFVKELANLYDWECSIGRSETGGTQFAFENVTPTQDAVR